MALNGRPLTAMRSFELIVPDFRRKSFSIPFVYLQLVRKFFQQSSAENILHLRGFLSEIYLQTQYG